MCTGKYFKTNYNIASEKPGFSDRASSKKKKKEFRGPIAQTEHAKCNMNA